MDSTGVGRSEMLINLAQRLRLYKPHHTPTEPTTNSCENPRIQGDSAEEKPPKQAELCSESAIHPQELRSKRAAVLICLFQGQNSELRVILTKRSSKLSTHSGEVALPGGKVEEGDANDIETALREAKEEIGLDPSLVDVVTVLESFTNKRGMTVVPVVGIVWDKNSMNLVANADEVDAIFDAPLEMFLKDENRRQQEREWMGNKYLLHFFDHQAENEVYVIWALTAGILINAASIIYQRPPDFQELRPKFWSRSRQ
nr:nudix hydrolase 15, mitochondrial-like isoform X1 [Ipomoea trifida]